MVFTILYMTNILSILASGLTLSLLAAWADIRTMAPAPSFRVLALAAVMVPAHIQHQIII